jgi:hypothetical protein
MTVIRQLPFLGRYEKVKNLYPILTRNSDLSMSNPLPVAVPTSLLQLPLTI